MATHTAPAEDGPPRKRVRKGTRSCWECKRRKVRCQLSQEDVPVCSGCLARGTTCLSQEYPEERELPSNANVGERLGRVESLLENLLAKIDSYEEQEDVQKIRTPESLISDVLTPFTSGVNRGDAGPLVTIVDSVGLGRLDSGVNANRSTGVRTPSCRLSKSERLRQTLVDLLPPQHVMDLVCESTSCWILIQALTSRPGNTGGEAGNGSIPSTFNLAEISMQSPIVIGRTLLYLAVCLQQLDPDFDRGQLNLLPSAEHCMVKYISTVQSLITSDDELVSTIEGLECLILQGLFHSNMGNLRRAWLTFRKAVSIGQLMGIHRRESSKNILGGRETWFNVVRTDRYLALLLSLPPGSADDEYGPNETFQNPDVDKDVLFSRKLCEISGRIITRNEAEYSHAYTATQAIDERLESLAQEVPPSWWQIPTILSDDRFGNGALQVNRLIIQIWYYQLESLLHLPFMLRAATDRRYEYNKLSCMKASREILNRYFALHSTQHKSICCKIMDYSALTSTVTLFLGLLEPTSLGLITPEAHAQRETDRALVQTLLAAMKKISRGGKDVVAAQSVDVITSLLAFDEPAGVHSSGNLRLTIPYFGTISIARPPPSPTAATSCPLVQHQPALPLEQAWPAQQLQQDAAGGPIVSFTSSQFPVMQVPQQPMLHDWAFPEADTLFFDSLLNSDIDGNWMF